MKKFYLFMVMLFAAIAANAVTLTGDVYDYQTKNSTGTQVTVEATINGATISVTDFLGSGKAFDITCYTSGSVSHNAGTGDTAGSYTINGTTYDSIYYYGSSDFAYTVNEDGTKVLDGIFWFGKNYEAEYQIIFTLPEDFEAEEYVAPAYLGQPYTVKATVADYYKKFFETDEIEMTIYVNGNTITIPNYLGGEDTITYTLGEDGSITGGMPVGYSYIDYTTAATTNEDGETVDGTNFYATYSYGGASFDAETRLLNDQFFVYHTQYAYTWVNIYFTLPLFTQATATLGEESSTFDVAYELGEQGVITFPQFLGTSLSPAFTVVETTVSNDINKGNYYSGVLGELGSYSPYLDKGSYLTQTYAENDGVKTISLQFYVSESEDLAKVVITLPESFVPQELEKNATAYAIVDGVQSEEAIPFHLETSISGSTVTISNPFGTSKFSFPFTMQTDGTIACTYAVGGFYTKACSFNGKSYVRFFEDSRVYDVENKTFIWTIGFTDDSDNKDFAASEQFVVYLPLPEDFEPSVPQVLEDYATRVVNVEHNIEKQVASSTTTAEITNLESRQITLTKIFNATVDVNVAWDENGKVTVDGTFPSDQWYTVNRKYYQYITIDADNSKYVKNDVDEYIEFAMSITGGYNGATEYPSASCRLYFVKNSADPQTITTYYYEYTDDEDGDDYTFKHVYTLDNTCITLKNFLDSPKDLTLRFHEIAEGEDYGVVEADWEDGEVVSGPFYAFGEEYETLTFDEAGWYVSRGSNYGYIDFAFGEKNVELYFSLPKSLMFDEAVSSVANIAVESAEGNVEYFNLQGVRVANPANGIFIRRAGNSVQKVLVK
jgi:hypothetical protein